MRRSRSSSNIPIAKLRRTLSSDSISQNSRPSSSSMHLNVPPPTFSRSNSGCSLKKSTTPLRGIPGIGKISSPSPRYSTAMIKNKSFNDEQFRKVSLFLHQKLADFEPKLLKPLSMTNFIFVIDLLLKEIDPRISVTKNNYKEMVIKYLKLFGYPGPMSMSLFKSISAPTSWAPAITILGWLVDLIENQNSPISTRNKLVKHVIMRLSRGFMQEDLNDFPITVDDVVGLDIESYESSADELKRLESQYSETCKQLEESQEEERKLQEKLDKMKLQIEEFYSNSEEKNVQKEIEEMTQTIQMKVIEAKELSDSNAKIKQILATQKYSFEEVGEIKKELEEVQYHLVQYTKNLEEVREIRSKVDLDYMNYNRKIELEVQKMNNCLLKMNLNSVLPNVKKFQVPDPVFRRQEFMKKFKEAEKNFQDIHSKVRASLALIEREKEEQEKRKMLCVEKLKISRAENVSLSAEMENLSAELERVTFENKLILEKKHKELTNILNGSQDVNALKKQEQELWEILQDLKDQIEKNAEKYVKCFMEVLEDFTKTNDDMQDEILKILEKRNEVLEVSMKQKYEILRAIEKVENGNY